METSDQPGGNLMTHLLAFGYLLHEMGVAVSPGQMLVLIEALGHVPITQREDFRAAARATLVLRREDLPLFEMAFEFFWRTSAGLTPEQELMMMGLPQMRVPQRQLRLPRRKPEDAKEGERPPEEEEIEIQLTYSHTEALRVKDFGQFSWEEVQACKDLIRRMRWKIEDRPNRRRRPDRGGRTLDMRRTLRQNMRYGGEPITLAWRETQREPRPLVVICDISGSMERYSRILLQFVHAISSGVGDVESFVFGTRLTRITRQLRHKDIDDSIDAVTKHVRDWSGGTRIGDAVKEFNYRWGRRVLGRGPVVLLISDGWDRGEPATLSREMDRLQRSCHRLIWLNPLLGSPGYEPLTIGMQAALPFVDDFLPVHNLVSLEQLGERLSTLGKTPTARRQRVLGAAG
ncbi:VWA domain-containing protein [Oscillochloris sp. ZM17-4]|uniref:vWA domain-containing protein n=1 Tax=Oscillochloris sp. ZM17-4 TaxID=2866714 RepID=UPI001C731E9E|nr:VWA domain-containing protein [Oscillochloris sp. ZM17-4]MBX0330240.1 VWA domain-containing protein [Oscillochloris sp. ZM17-4]